MRTWWLMAEGVRCSSVAAATKDPSREAASKACTDLSGGIFLIVLFLGEFNSSICLNYSFVFVLSSC